MNDTTDATAIFAPLWRRKWLILAVAIVVAVVSYAYYKRETPTYEASTQLYLGAAAEEVAPNEKSPSKANSTELTNEATVINSIVVEEVRKQLRAEHRGALAHGGVVRAKASEKGSFIGIETEAHSGRAAALLANLVAQTYIHRQAAQHRRVVERAIAITRRQLRRVEAANNAKVEAAVKGKGSSASSTSSIIDAANLNTKINQLESNLEVTGAQQVKPAKPANSVQTAPEPRKDAIFGFVLGFVLTAIAVYVLSRFDRRLRSLAGVEQAFDAPILAALPKVNRPIVYRDGLPTPSKVLLEPLRRLHTALRLGDTLGQEQGAPSTLLVISPDPGDGKSMLVADLALVKRDAGERVAVVEANFRRPVQAKLLGFDDAPGLAEVLAGRLPLEEAMRRVLPADQALQVEAEAEGDGGGVATAVQEVAGPQVAGSLFLLAGGGSVSNPPAVLAEPAMAELLRALAADFDYVLVDAPSPLQFSDVMPLLKQVDGIVLVGRVGHTREASAARLKQLLGQTPSAPILGVVANCVASRDLERYGFSSPTGQGWSARLLGR